MRTPAEAVRRRRSADEPEGGPGGTNRKKVGLKEPPGRSDNSTKMSFLRSSEHEIRRLLASAVAWRWPKERLLFTTECDVRSTPVGGRSGDTPEDSIYLIHEGPSDLPADPRPERGLLGVTQSRLICQGRSRTGAAFRAASFVLAGIAVASLYLGGGIESFVYGAVPALVLRVVAWAIEVYECGGGSFEFAGIRRIDQFEQFIEGLGRFDTLYRVRIPDATDFRMVVNLVTGATV